MRTSGQDHGAPTDDETIVRPSLVGLLGVPATYLAISALSVRSAVSGSEDAFTAWFFPILTCFVIATSVRERLVITGDEVRVIRLFREDRFAPCDVVSVAKSGGRGQPSHVVVLDRRPVDPLHVELVGSRRIEERTIGLRLPSLMTARRAAHALDAPLTTYGGEPAGPPFPQDLRSEVGLLVEWRTAGGRVRPMVVAYGVLLTVLVSLLTAIVIDGAA
ncbi:MAG: hypothetical protein KF703_02375 [Actinobacteria bacterium]|nr:hypothetical protein [Actinomycetota bacterium]